MASQQLNQMNELYAPIKEWLSKPDIDLATRRDIAENAHLAASEPEGVTYAEVDASGVPGAVVYPRALRSGSRSAAQPRRRHSRHLDAH